MTTARSLPAVRLSGELEVALPPEQAFRLFTARGEVDWVPGWAPEFPAETPDDTAPGTVWRTSAHGRETTWVVVQREAPFLVGYARVVPGVQAGTVTVRLDTLEGGRSHVRVAYRLTALSEAAGRELSEFAAGYPGMLREWQDLIERYLA
jgi:hypothetical protein